MQGQTEPPRREAWASGEAYDPFVGRWSRLVAREFVSWLDVAPDRDWLDVGCGTGALSATIIAQAAPASLRGVDPSPGFVAFARERIRDTQAIFDTGDAQALPVGPATCDAVVSGLVLNFVPVPARALAEFARVLRPRGIAGAYVWDYAGEMQMLRHFFDAASALDPAAREHDEGSRFPICQPGPLGDLFRSAGFAGVETRSIDIRTIFADFDDYWTPFLGGQGPAPAYAASLSDDRRELLREYLRNHLKTEADGSIHLTARAWAAKGWR